MPDFYAEPYLHLASLSHKSALISWGAFYFRLKGGSTDGAKLVDDGDLKHVFPPRRESIGARSEPYGPAIVEVRDQGGRVVAEAVTDQANHVWISGLEPDTTYRYVVRVKGEEWASGTRLDWDPVLKGLRDKGRAYRNEFRTFPDPKASSGKVAFAVIGDFGVGVRKEPTDSVRQAEVAEALRAALDSRQLRFVVTAGDNIYASKKIGPLPIGGQGDEDDDWFFTFYQPYRYVINRIPVFPCIGNHDASETEDRDDRDQVMDNFYLRERLASEVPAGRASIYPGLFYRFSFGKDVELVALDTSKEPDKFSERLILHPNHRGFLESAFPAATGEPRWLIPFCHHPPYCAGPLHGNTKEFLERKIDFAGARSTLLERFARAGVRVVLSGHEHNFQHSRADGIDFLVTGGAGKVRTDRPKTDDWQKAHTQSWCAECHFLLVTIEGRRLTADVIGAADQEALVRRLPEDVAGGEVALPIAVNL